MIVDDITLLFTLVALCILIAGALFATHWYLGKGFADNDLGFCSNKGESGTRRWVMSAPTFCSLSMELFF